MSSSNEGVEQEILFLINKFERATSLGKRIQKQTWKQYMANFLEKNNLPTDIKPDRNGMYNLCDTLSELRGILFTLRKNRNWSMRERE